MKNMCPPVSKWSFNTIPNEARMSQSTIFWPPNLQSWASDITVVTMFSGLKVDRFCMFTWPRGSTVVVALPLLQSQKNCRVPSSANLCQIDAIAAFVQSCLYMVNYEYLPAPRSCQFGMNKQYLQPLFVPCVIVIIKYFNSEGWQDSLCNMH